jgi:integrase/recombinase XerD
MSNTTSFGYPIPTVRTVSALRQRMIDDMRNFAPNTQVSYLHQVNLFARHFNKSPEQLGPEEIRTY